MHTVIETPIFQRMVVSVLTDSERQLLIEWIAGNPLAGDVIPGVDSLRKVHAVTLTAAAEARARVGVSQSEFARLLGVSVRTLQDWEQGRRQPSGAAKTLLRIAAQSPQAVRMAG